MGITFEDQLQRLEGCSKIRNIASQRCLLTLQQLLSGDHKFSEIKFKNRWFKELEKSYVKGFISCWYDPPPDGIAVLFAQENSFERVIYPNLRSKLYWPKPNIYLKQKGLGYLFASPYSMIEDIPIIGDFGLSFYLGKKNKIKDHFKKAWNVLNILIDRIDIGMTFKDMYLKSIKFIQENGLNNFMESLTDKACTDLGHTIPFIDRNPNDKEQNSVNSGDRKVINQIISKARIFINQIEEYRIGNNCAFTFEPRFISREDKLPMCSFHTIIQFLDGKKIVLKNFEGIFNLLGMNWIRE